MASLAAARARREATLRLPCRERRGNCDASFRPGGEAEAGLLELRGKAGPHRLDFSFGVLGKIDVGHVVHAAGDEHLQDAFFGSDIAERAAHAGWERTGVELPEDRAFAAVVVPA